MNKPVPPDPTTPPPSLARAETDGTSPTPRHLAPQPEGAEGDLGDPRAGGSADRAPRSLHAVELEPDDESVSSNDEWDDPDRL